MEEGFIDHDTGNKAREIIKKYLFEPISEETCDLVMEDVRATFGEDISAQVKRIGSGKLEVVEGKADAIYSILTK